MRDDDQAAAVTSTKESARGMRRAEGEMFMSEFQIELVSSGRWLIAQLSGHVEILRPELLTEVLNPLLAEDNHRVVLDMAGLSYINSVALGVLIDFRKQLMDLGGELRLAGASEQIADVFRQTRLVEVFPIYKDSALAVQG